MHWKGQDVTPADPIPGGADPADWATLWQSEVAALAVDREAQEGIHAWCQAWSSARERLAGHHAAAGRTDADAAARPTPAAAAADPRDEQIEQLRRRIAELEG